VPLWRPARCACGGGAGVPGARSVKHRPADAVPQPLVVKYELANRLWELATLPPALESPCGLGFALRRASTCGLDRIGGRTEFVRRDVRDGPGLASSVRGMPCRPAQVSGRPHCMASRRASLGHRHLATHPGAGMLDRLTRSWVLRLGRLEQVKDVLRARCRPKSEELVIGIGEGPTAADRHEARVSDLREDHGWPPSAYIRPAPIRAQHPRRRTRDQARPKQSLQTRWPNRKLAGCTEWLRPGSSLELYQKAELAISILEY
jgi:hypothetical protein